MLQCYASIGVTWQAIGIGSAVRPRLATPAPRASCDDSKPGFRIAMQEKSAEAAHAVFTIELRNEVVVNRTFGGQLAA